MFRGWERAVRGAFPMRPDCEKLCAMRETGPIRQSPEPDALDSSSVPTRGDAVLDLEHLARQCLDDADLETELLHAFRTQSTTLAALIADGDDLLSPTKADIAHRLRGSALAVGAFPVARAAEAVERAKKLVEMSQAIAKLREAVSQAAAEIDRMQTQRPE